MIAVNIIGFRAVRCFPRKREAIGLRVIACRSQNRRFWGISAACADAVFAGDVVRDLHIGDGLHDIAVGSGSKTIHHSAGFLCRAEHLNVICVRIIGEQLIRRRSLDGLPGKCDAARFGGDRRHNGGLQRGKLDLLRGLFAVQNFEHAEADIFVTLRRCAAFLAVLGAAVGAGRIPCAALDAQRAVRADRRRPFPNIAPEIDCTMRAARDLGIFFYRCSAVIHAAVEVCILGHMTGGKLPFALVRKTVGVRTVPFRQPRAVGFGVRSGDVVYGEIILPSGIGTIRPVLRRGIAGRGKKSGVLRVGHQGARNIDALACAHNGDIVPLQRTAAVSIDCPKQRKRWNSINVFMRTFLRKILFPGASLRWCRAL